MLQDTAAFSSLVGMHQGKVRGFLLRLTGDYDLANDIAQDTFINAYQNIAQFREKESISGWLMKIAFNNFLQHRRSNKRRDEITQQLGTDLENTEKIYDSISPDQLDLESAIAKLSPEQAAAITLCHSYGFSHSEAAEILKLPLGTVKTNIARGKKRLASLLNTTTQWVQLG